MKFMAYASVKNKNNTISRHAREMTMTRPAANTAGEAFPQVPLLPVILSGGSGSRLWPLSRREQPKPFIPLPGGGTLLGRTLARLRTLPHCGQALTVTSRDYYFLTRDTAGGRDPRAGDPEMAYLLEPCARNTAAAIAAAALWSQGALRQDAVLLVLPSDHLVDGEEGFALAVGQAWRLAAQGYLVTFGIRPGGPETGFGYIARGDTLGHGFRVERFLEKPARDVAETLAGDGRHYWNSGMFCFRADTLLAGLAEHAPEVLEGAAAAWQETRPNGDTWWLGASFSRSPDISIDYALMERSGQSAVVPANFGWSDLGAWSAFAELVAEDPAGNRFHGGEILGEDASGCTVFSPDRFTALLGVENLLVVDTPDALLVASRDRDQDVKKIVERLRRENSPLADTHVTTHRPWGSYTVLEEGEHFKIKKILVKPGAKLSLQMHHHRSEHWIVVSGTAKVVVGEEERLVMTNESTFIRAGRAHRLENPGILPLVLIEVQSGAYLGEDDIVRLEDIYGRTGTPGAEHAVPGKDGAVHRG